MNNLPLYKEKKILDNEKLMTERIIAGQQEVIAKQLLGDMGKDINDVLSGKVKVKLSLKEKIKYTFRFWVNKFFRTF